MKKSFMLMAAWILLALSVTVSAAARPDMDDPDYIKKNRLQAAEAVKKSSDPVKGVNPYTGKYYYHRKSLLKDRTIVNGLDVSKWDGNINWTKVKKAGIDFAIIRLGYSRLSTGIHTLDPYYRQNIRNAKAAGVKVGVYYFAQSINTREALAEAEYVLKILGKEKLDFPVVFDSEDTYGGRLYRAHLSKSAYTKIAETFCDRIKKAGYSTMVYSSYSGWKDSYDHSKLKKEYGIWLARYNVATYFDDTYCIWQYTETGRVSGINGYCDVNFYYRPKNAKTPYVDETGDGGGDEPSGPVVENVQAKSISDSAIKVTFDKYSKAKYYEIYRSDSYGGTYKKLGHTKTTSYVDRKVTRGTEYYYRVQAVFKKSSLDLSSPARAYIPMADPVKIKTTQLCHVRKMAGTQYDSIGYLRAGTTCTLKAVTKNEEGIVWYRVEAVVRGETCRGYISSRCSKKS